MGFLWEPSGTGGAGVGALNLLGAGSARHAESGVEARDHGDREHT